MNDVFWVPEHGQSWKAEMEFSIAASYEGTLSVMKTHFEDSNRHSLGGGGKVTPCNIF